MLMMWYQLTLQFTVTCLVLITGIDSKNDYEMVFESHSCTQTDGDSLLRSLSCSLGKNAKRRGLNMEMKLNEKVDNFQMDLLIVMPRKTENFTLVNLTDLNGCDVLANRNMVTLLRLWRTNVERYCNFPRNCPLLADVIYYVRGFRFDLDMTPAFSFEAVMNVWYKLRFSPRTWVDGYVKGVVGLKGGKTFKLQ